MKQNTHILIVFLIIFATSEISGQNIKISLERIIEFNKETDLVLPLYKCNPTERQEYVLPDTTDFRTTILKCFNFDGVRVDFLIALTSNKRYICIDANQNKNFTDDVVYTFPEMMKDVDSGISAIVNIPSKRLFFEILPFVDSQSGIVEKDEVRSAVYIKPLERYDGYFEFNGYEYKTEIYPRANRCYLFFKDRDYLDGTRKLSLVDCNVQLPSKKTDFNIDSLVFHLDSINFQERFVQISFKKVELDSVSLGTPIINGSFYGLTDGREYTTKDLHGKYTLIDFWGPWCAPCIAQMPEVKEVYEKYKKKGLNVISISTIHGTLTTSEKKQLEQTHSLVKKLKMVWPQYYAYAHKTPSFTSSIVDKLNISAWPQYILLEPNGKIIIGKNQKTSSLPTWEEVLEELQEIYGD